MMDLSFITVFVGVILFGTFIGSLLALIPGLHQNNIALLILISHTSLLAFFGYIFQNVTLTSVDLLFLTIVFLVSLITANIFLDIIPSIYFGAPDTTKSLSVLPGHRLLIAGKGFEGCKLVAFGTLLGIIIGVLFLIPAKLILTQPVNLHTSIYPFISLILIFVSMLLIFLEYRKTQVSKQQTIDSIQNSGLKKIVIALFLFLMSGTLGILVLLVPGLYTYNITLFSVKDIGIVGLFPMFSGFFGISSLFVSLKNIQKIPEQQIDQKFTLPYIKNKDYCGPVYGTLIGAFAGFFPGITPGSGGTIYTALFQKDGTEDFESQRRYLLAVSAIESSALIFNILALFTILRARTGALSIAQILFGSYILPWNSPETIPQYFTLLIFAILISGFIAYFILLYISALYAKFISGVDSRRISKIIMIVLITMVVLLSGPVGVAILITSTFLGLIPHYAGTSRVHLMGAIIVPTILIFI